MTRRNWSVLLFRWVRLEECWRVPWNRIYETNEDHGRLQQRIALLTPPILPPPSKGPNLEQEKGNILA